MLINPLTFHIVVAIFISVLVYRRTMEFNRLKALLRSKDEMIAQQLRIIKKLKTIQYNIKDGDVHTHKVDQRVNTPQKVA